MDPPPENEMVEDYPEVQWPDMPAPIAGRRSLADYCVGQGYKKSTARPMMKALGSNAIEVWMIGSRGDELCVDAALDTGRLYHVKGDDFAHFHAISDADTFVDRYCAYLLDGGDVASFDFRRS